MKIRTAVYSLICVLFLLAFAGCNTKMGYPKTPYTSGNVSLTLKKGETTQQQVLEAFGAPNIVTQDAEDNSVWTYQTNATVTRNAENSNSWNILLGGGNYGDSGFMRSQKTMTIIITFKGKTVSNFKSLSTSF
jgi:outer membrane protein assembly factor BamE (lipoprotein component of BamABCDE complex)